MGLQGGARVAIFFREGIAIMGKLGAIPFLVQNLGQRLESVRELRGKHLGQLTGKSSDVRLEAEARQN